MRVSVTEAKDQLTELVRRAEAGDEVVLTRHGRPTVRLVPVQRLPNAETRRKVTAEVQAAAAEKRTPGAGNVGVSVRKWPSFSTGSLSRW